MIENLIVMGAGIIGILMAATLAYMLDRAAYLARKENGHEGIPPKFFNFSG